MSANVKLLKIILFSFELWYKTFNVALMTLCIGFLNNWNLKYKIILLIINSLGTIIIGSSDAFRFNKTIKIFVSGLPGIYLIIQIIYCLLNPENLNPNLQAPLQVVQLYSCLKRSTLTNIQTQLRY